MKLRKLLALGVVVMFVIAMFVAPSASAMESATFSVLDIPAEDWYYYNNPHDVTGSWSFAGSEGEPLVITAYAANGWGRAQVQFEDVLEEVTEVRINFTVDGGSTYVMLWQGGTMFTDLVHEDIEGAYGTDRWRVPAGTYDLTFDLTASPVDTYGFWFQVIGGGAMVTINNLEIDYYIFDDEPTVPTVCEECGYYPCECPDDNGTPQLPVNCNDCDAYPCECVDAPPIDHGTDDDDGDDSEFPWVIVGAVGGVVILGAVVAVVVMKGKKK